MDCMKANLFKTIRTLHLQEIAKEKVAWEWPDTGKAIAIAQVHH
jgi:hypothetical protein